MYSYFEIGLKPAVVRAAMSSSSANCTRELFKGSNKLDSLLVCTLKNIFWLRVADFFWVTS